MPTSESQYISALRKLSAAREKVAEARELLEAALRLLEGVPGLQDRVAEEMARGQAWAQWLRGLAEQMNRNQARAIEMMENHNGITQSETHD